MWQVRQVKQVKGCVAYSVDCPGSTHHYLGFKGKGKQQHGKWAFGRQQKPIHYVWDRSYTVKNEVKKLGC